MLINLEALILHFQNEIIENFFGMVPKTNDSSQSFITVLSYFLNKLFSSSFLSILNSSIWFHNKCKKSLGELQEQISVKNKFFAILYLLFLLVEIVE